MEDKTKLNFANKEVVKVNVRYERFDEEINRALVNKYCVDVHVIP